MNRDRKRFLLVAACAARLSLPLMSACGETQIETPPADAHQGYSPEKHEAARYEGIWKKSPFVLETKIVAQTRGLADRFALTGIARVAGQPVAWVLDRQSNVRSMVSKQPSDNSIGMELVSISEAAETRNSTAVVKIGGETGTIRFDMKLLQMMSGEADAAASASQQHQGFQGASNPYGARVPGQPNTAQSVPATSASGSVPQPNVAGVPQEPPPQRILKRRIITSPPSE